MNHSMILEESADVALVRAVLGGDREAYASLVRRHQAAVCGLAYSVCGDFAASEDIAQEAFIAAWLQLADLREPGQFRAWLCGIARHIALGHVRQRTRRREEPSAAGTLAPELPSGEATPQELAVSAEEQALLWRALERLPETYREPLVLFYREHQSVQAVAGALGLSEDAVRQRLSRGRELLREEVARLLERIMGRTSPGVLFSIGVLAALPPLTAAVTTGAVAGIGTAKTAGTGTGTILAQALGPVMGGGLLASLFMGLLWIYLGVRMGRSPGLAPAQKAVMRTLFLRVVTLTLLLTGFLCWLGFTGGVPLREAGLNPAGVLSGVVILFLCADLGCALLAARALGRLQKALAQDLAARGPEAWNAYCSRTPVRRSSQRQLLGLPLWAISFGADPAKAERMGCARAWVAVGDIAEGGLLAVGGLALAPIAVGGASLGLLSIGGASLGLLAVGGLCAGGVSCGGLAAGWWFAAGGLAISNWAALGGMALSGNWALGGLSFGLHANDSVALMHAHTDPAVVWFLRLAPYGGFLSLLGLPGAFVLLRQLRKAEARTKLRAKDHLS
jgi:RNA polymerase sigma factor (sigma-70 family)